MYVIPQLRGDEKAEYVRKSRKDDPLLTIEEVLAKHEQEIADWLDVNQAEGGPIPEENIFREVVSGETIEDRPKMKELLRLIESPKIKAIVCKEPSRLSRGDLMDIGYLVKILRYTGTLVFTMRGCYDLRDERDREQFERELMRGNDYLEYQKKIMTDGKHLAVRNGWYIGSYPPYGYKKISVKVGGHTCHTLEPIPEEAEVVRQIFELYRSGVGSSIICDILDAQHTKPQRGENWTPGTITRMLKNIHYIGKVTWFKVRQGHRVENGDIKRYKYTTDDYPVYDGRHPAIIDQDLWDDVQAIKGQLPPRKKGTEMLNPFAGVMYCSCGKVMSYKQTRSGGKDIGAPRFRCSDRRCRSDNGSALASEVIAGIIKELQNCIADFRWKLEQGDNNDFEVHQQTIARLQKKLDGLRELEVKQWDEKLKGLMPEHIFERLNAKTVADINEVTQALIDSQSTAPERIDLSAKIGTFEQTVAVLQTENVPVKEANALVKACISRILYSRPRMEKTGGKKGNPHPFKLEVHLRV